MLCFTAYITLYHIILYYIILYYIILYYIILYYIILYYIILYYIILYYIILYYIILYYIILYYIILYYIILCYVIPISYSIVLHIIRADILLIARIIPRLFGGWKNTTQLGKYPRVLYEKPSNKIYILYCIISLAELLV